MTSSHVINDHIVAVDVQEEEVQSSPSGASSGHCWGLSLSGAFSCTRLGLNLVLSVGLEGLCPGLSSGAGAAPTTTEPQHPVLHCSCMEINAQPGTWSSFRSWSWSWQPSACHGGRRAALMPPPSQESPCSLSLLMEATAPGCRLNEKGFVGQLVREAAGEAAKLLGFEWPSGFYIIIQMLP